MRSYEWIVKREHSGCKLLKFLSLSLDEAYSNRKLKEAIEQGNCIVNNRVERFASILLGFGDHVLFKIEEKKPLTYLPIQELFSDDHLIIYNKPAGISSENQNFPLGTLVHRLDKETSGLLLAAKHEDAEKALLNLFKQREIKKDYLALVDGNVRKNKGIIENFLIEKLSYQGQKIWGEHLKQGLYAKTSWKLLSVGKQASLLHCQPTTGRMHQLRVHLSGFGHPILGDYHYGKTFKCLYKPKRLLLHASRLCFIHPLTKEKIDIYAPIPEDFKEAMEALACTLS